MTDGLESIAAMDYPGRGLIVGQEKGSDDPRTFVAYFVTGRSDSSRARVMEEGPKTGTVYTDATDLETLQKGSPLLLVYPAIMTVGSGVVVSNGVQTNLLHTELMRKMDELPEDAGASQEYTACSDVLSNAFMGPNLMYDKKDDRDIDITTFEPDPCHTPRINAVTIGSQSMLHIVCRGEDGEREDFTNAYTLEPGEGRFISTYDGGKSDPLQSFTGSPFKVGIPWTNAEQAARYIYVALAPSDEDDLRVSVAAMFISADGQRDTYIRNRYVKKNNETG